MNKRLQKVCALSLCRALTDISDPAPGQLAGLYKRLEKAIDAELFGDICCRFHYASSFMNCLAAS